MTLVNGPISQNDLMLRLATAKKVMNKVDNGTYEKGNIDESSLISDNNEYIMDEPNVDITSTSDRINNSKLPDNIKKAMIENPIPNITLNESLGMDFVKQTKKIMESQGMPVKQQKRQPTPINNSDIINTLTPIIENVIRKTLDDIIDKKLSQILSAQKTTELNENLVIKVGESVFKGKITGVAKSK